MLRKMIRVLRGRDDEVQITRRVGVARWRWNITLCKFDGPQHWSLHLFCFWIYLKRSATPSHDCMLDQWGASADFEFRSVRFHWGDRCKSLYMPHMLEWVRTDWMDESGKFVTAERAGRPWWLGGKGRLYRRADGSMTPAEPFVPGDGRRNFDSRKPSPGRLVVVMPYIYMLKSGEFQHRTATVTADRRAWTWLFLYKLGLHIPIKTNTGVWVEFDAEVGEGTGSWKGGVMGCGTDLKPGETVQSAVRRMEAEREFGR